MGARVVVFVGAIVLWPSSAFAHDYWLVPAQYVVSSDRDVKVSLFVGEDFVGDEEKHFERARTTRLTLFRADKTEDHPLRRMRRRRLGIVLDFLFIRDGRSVWRGRRRSIHVDWEPDGTPVVQMALRWGWSCHLDVPQHALLRSSQN